MNDDKALLDTFNNLWNTSLNLEENVTENTEEVILLERTFSEVSQETRTKIMAKLVNIDRDNYDSDLTDEERRDVYLLNSKELVKFKFWIGRYTLVFLFIFTLLIYLSSILTVAVYAINNSIPIETWKPTVIIDFLSILLNSKE